MAKFRFVHAADIHLDSPLRGLEADPGAPAELIRARLGARSGAWLTLRSRKTPRFS